MNFTITFVNVIVSIMITILAAILVLNHFISILISAPKDYKRLDRMFPFTNEATKYLDNELKNSEIKFDFNGVLRHVLLTIALAENMPHLRRILKSMINAKRACVSFETVFGENNFVCKLLRVSECKRSINYIVDCIDRYHQMINTINNFKISEHVDLSNKDKYVSDLGIYVDSQDQMKATILGGIVACYREAFNLQDDDFKLSFVKPKDISLADLRKCHLSRKWYKELGKISLIQPAEDPSVFNTGRHYTVLY